MAVFCAVSAVLSAETVSTKNWTIAAEKFILTQKTNSKSTESVRETLPVLVLEQLADNLNRMPRGQEQLDRALYELQKKRISLFLQLSKEVQTRDSILLNDYSQRKLAAKLKEADKKIAELQKQIYSNFDEVDKEKSKYADRIRLDEEREKKLKEGLVVDSNEEENKFASLFRSFVNLEKDSVVIENVVLYKGDFNQLYDAGEDKRTLGYDSYEFEKSCVDAGINGLLTGKVTIYGGFVSVAISLYQFPGGRLIGSAMDVGTIDELKALATNLAMQITPRIADSMPVELDISVSPDEAKEDFLITIDDVVYKSTDNRIIVQSGIHTVNFSSKGFDSVSGTYNFSGNRKFTVEVEMLESHEGEANVRLVKPYAGDIFGNGIFGGSIDNLNPYGKIKVNNRVVLGHFVTKDGLPAEFIIPEKYLVDGSYLQVKAKPFDRSQYIETRRKWMYASYSALIVSLIPSFYCYGNSNAAALSYNHDYGTSYDEAKKWQTASNVTTGISIGVGVFFVYELVRYLMAANTVLPAKAKPVGKKELKRLETEALLKAEALKADQNNENEPADNQAESIQNEPAQEMEN